MRACVYQPCGIDALQPAPRNGTGFSSNVIVNAAFADAGTGAGVGVGVGVIVDDGFPQAPTTPIVIANRPTAAALREWTLVARADGGSIASPVSVTVDPRTELARRLRGRRWGRAERARRTRRGHIR